MLPKFRCLLSPAATFFLALPIGVLWMYNSSKSIVWAQNDQALVPRLIILDRRSPTDPFEVVKFEEGEALVLPDVPFNADDDWLKKLSVTVKNTSQKDVTRVSVNLLFPDTGDGTFAHPYSGYQLDLGYRSQHDLSTSSGEKISQLPGPALLLEHGQELTVSLASHYDDIKVQIEPRNPISMIRNCRVSFGFYFADGTRWSASSYYEPDPLSMSRYLPISFQEFTQYSASN
jgi:hypothetical protein